MSRLVRVIGVGSPHGDDAIGLEVLRRLQKPLPETERGVEAFLPSPFWGGVLLEFHAVDSGQRLLDLLDGKGSLILIDAIKNESAVPGTIHRLTWPDPRLDALHPGSTHSLGVAQALQLAAALNQLPEKVVIYAIEIASAEPGEGFSRDVAGAIPEVIARIRAEIEGMRKEI